MSDLVVNQNVGFLMTRLIYINGCRSSRIKALFTRQPFSMQKVNIHCCLVSSVKWINVFARQSFLKQKKKKKKKKKKRSRSMCSRYEGFYVPPTAKVIRRRNVGLKSLPKDWRSQGSHSRPLIYKASALTTKPRRLFVWGATYSAFVVIFINLSGSNSMVFNLMLLYV